MAARPKKAGHQLEIDGHQVTLSNLEKVLYPEAGFTKAQVIDFYIRVSDYLLPHLKSRPVTLKRYPDGTRGKAFYEKQEPSFAPKWIETFPVPRRAGGKDICYILINHLATLVWCANAASLELHPFLHCAPRIDEPTSLVFDLDPGEGTNLITCAEISFILLDLLTGLKLQAFPKVSGSKGLQVYVPLNNGLTYRVTQAFAKAVAELLAKAHPDRVVAAMAKNKRANKIFVDWSQNSDFKTTVGVYSLRAKQDRPFVSLPVTWDELKALVRTRNMDALQFDPESALKRLGKVGDLFAPLLSLRQALPDSVAHPIGTPRAPAAAIRR